MPGVARGGGGSGEDDGGGEQKVCLGPFSRYHGQRTGPCNGFVEENELNRLANKAFAFANPRPSSFASNKLNYPSKLLLYLAYGKPIISTFTDGVSPEYNELLIPIKDETDECLSEAIKQVLNMKEGKYKDMRDRIKKFNETHTWTHQVEKFVSWLLTKH